MSTLFLSLLILFLVIFLIIIIILLVYYNINQNKKLNSDCSTQKDCDPNLVCSISGPNNLKTVCKSGLNQSCTYNEDCAFGLNCSNGKCIAAGIPISPETLTNRLLSGGPSPLHRLTMPKNPGWFGIPKENKTKLTDDTGTVSSVCTLLGNNLTCRPRVGENLYSSPVIDVCSYSEYLIFLLQNGNLIVEENENKNYRVSSNVSLKYIVNYRGYLYGLSKEGFLYYLPNDYLRKSHWNWKKDNINFKAEHISASFDSESLWLQNKNSGILYDKERQIIEQMNDIEGIRIMGNNFEEFLVLIDNKAYLFPSKKILENVKYAVYDDEHEIISLKSDDNDFSRIVFTGYKPYYIRI